MPFEDRFPFKSLPPDDWYEHERVRSADGRSRPSADAPPSGFEGRLGIYRLAFKAMEVPGFPDEVRIGNARIAQGPGPIWSQRTHVAQVPGVRPHYVKRMEWVEVGSDYHLTVCELDVTIPADMAQAMHTWGDQGRAAVAIVAALLDERVAQEQLAEELLIFDETESRIESVVDQVFRIREFQPLNRMLGEHVAAIESAVGDLDLAEDSPVLAATRWYLRGAQQGPTPDAIVFFWVALEALSKPPYRTKLTSQQKNLTDVAWVESAVQAAGLDPNTVTPSIGRLAGLRAEIVHGGVEQPELLAEGYYATEALVRLLLRHRLGLGEVGWPLQPEVPNLRQSLWKAMQLLQPSPVVEWRS